MRIYRNTTGQSLLEFGFVFPILLLMVMGLFDIGRAILYYATLNTAVREGTRIAIVQPDCDYMANPGSCAGGYMDSYPLNCVSATSTANIAICSEIENKLLTGELSGSTITINHTISSTSEPEINIGIDFLFEPITPGIALMGDLTMHVNSHMLRAPITEP